MTREMPETVQASCGQSFLLIYSPTALGLMKNNKCLTVLIMGDGDGDERDDKNNVREEYTCPIWGPSPWDFNPSFVPIGTSVTPTR